MIEVGKRLPNGATVLASRPASGNYNLVLAWRQESDDPFVTWKVDPETGDAFWGHYHESITQAVEDYEERT